MPKWGSQCQFSMITLHHKVKTIDNYILTCVHEYVTLGKINFMQQHEYFVTCEPKNPYFKPKWGSKCQFSVITLHHNVKTIDNYIITCLYEHVTLGKTSDTTARIFPYLRAQKSRFYAKMGVTMPIFNDNSPS